MDPSLSHPDPPPPALHHAPFTDPVPPPLSAPHLNHVPFSAPAQLSVHRPLSTAHDSDDGAGHNHNHDSDDDADAGPSQPWPALSPRTHTPLGPGAQTYPLRTPPRPLLQRLSYRSRAFMHRRSAKHAVFSAVDSDISAPTFVKTYPAHSKLPVAVYIPPPDASRPGPLPLYVHVAPTSFLKPTPPPPAPKKRKGRAGPRKLKGPATAADLLCSRLSRQHGICVACVGFRSPPRWLFPTQVWDVVGLVHEIVAGTGLPIDRGRVAVGGIGAGGSVALGAVQADELQGLVKAVVALAPIVDWSVPFDGKALHEEPAITPAAASPTPETPTAQQTEGDETDEPEAPREADIGALSEETQKKSKRKQKKQELKLQKQTEKQAKQAEKSLLKEKRRSRSKMNPTSDDFQESQNFKQKQGSLAAELYDLMDWSYVPPRCDRANAMLSPAYAPGEKLPHNLFLAGIAGDVLCAETERLAIRLAAERDFEGLPDQNSWERAGVRWEKADGWQQSFFEAVEKGAEQAQKKSLELLVDELGDWLWRMVYM